MFRPRRADGHEVSVNDQPADARLKVLIANADPMLHLLVRATLDRARYATVEARDGDEALTRTRDDRPDLIVLDMMMPRRSGPQVLAALRDDPDPATAATPVIMLTARSRAIEMLIGEDAERYLAKPFSPSRLASLVDELLAPAASAPDPSGGSAQSASTSAKRCSASAP
jgi:two-component system, OmpR family, alkaline phosphatase synthesis response regulator PhoP